jgi:glucose-6-phosphate 1-dehydrogenase
LWPSSPVSVGVENIICDRLKEQLERLQAARDIGGNQLFYLATVPDAFAPIVRQLGRLG